MHFLQYIPIKRILWIVVEVGGSFVCLYTVKSFLPNFPSFIRCHSCIFQFSDCSRHICNFWPEYSLLWSRSWLGKTLHLMHLKFNCTHVSSFTLIFSLYLKVSYSVNLHDGVLDNPFIELLEFWIDLLRKTKKFSIVG